MQKYLGRLFDHLFWADRCVLQVLDTLDPAQHHEAFRLFAHVVAAERVWLLRMRGQDASAQPIWPQWTPAELRAAADDNVAGYDRYLRELAEDGLEAEARYTNSQGVAFETRIVDILTHVALHGSYHRGQIAAALRRSGAEPVNTDYITYVREQG